MKKLITILIAIGFAIQAEAQYLEAGVMGGTTSYIGDLQPGAPDMRSFGTSGGAFVRWNYSPNISVKGSAFYGSFVASDHYANNNRKVRNLESVTSLYELALTGEYNLTKFDIVDGKISAPYIFAGVAGVYFNPQAKMGTTVYDLQTLGTEGQLLNGGKSYSRYTVAIPVGAGFKMAINRRLNFGFELGFRYTLTDYLDDVSGKYPDLVALAQQNPTAAVFSYRTPEYFNQKLENPQGIQRGDTYKFDIYYTAAVSLSYNFASRSKMEFNKSYRDFFNTH